MIGCEQPLAGRPEKEMAEREVAEGRTGWGL